MTAAISLSPPFNRGETFFNGGTVDSTSGANLEGTEWVFDDLDLSVPNVNTPRTNQKVRCRIVRNVSTIALLPKRLARFKTSGKYETQVDGYSGVTAFERCYPIDEWLPAAGVPVNDLFYIVVDGPATVKLELTASVTAVSVGDWLAGQTAAASTSVTAGFATTVGITMIATTAMQQIQNAIGRAMSAMTSGGTGNPIMVSIGKW